MTYDETTRIIANSFVAGDRIRLSGPNFKKTYRIDRIKDYGSQGIEVVLFDGRWSTGGLSSLHDTTLVEKMIDGRYVPTSQPQELQK